MSRCFYLSVVVLLLFDMFIGIVRVCNRTYVVFDILFVLYFFVFVFFFSFFYLFFF